MKYFCLFFALFFGLTTATTWGDRLDVTWGEFYGLPITNDELSEYYFEPWQSNGKSCDENFGYQWWDGSNNSTVVMMGANGQIAGVQVNIVGTPSNNLTKSGYWQQLGYGDLWTLTLYFSDPSSICDDQAEFHMHEDGSTALGDRLWLVQSDGYWNIPLNDTSLPGWVLGKCFVSMGTHWWYGISEDMDCDEFFPVGTMYQGGNLVTFLVNTPITQNEKYFEHPPQWTLAAFFKSGTQPECLANYSSLSTMHFFSTNPVLNTCL